MGTSEYKGRTEGGARETKSLCEQYALISVGRSAICESV